MPLDRHELSTCLIQSPKFVVANLLLLCLALAHLDKSFAAPPKKEQDRSGTATAVREPRSENSPQEPGVVMGEVMGEDGTAVANAIVLLRDGKLLQTTTDESGRFRLSGVSPERLWIWATKDALASPKELLDGRKSASSAGGLFAPVRLTISPAKKMKLTVTSAVTGQPLGGAVVRLGYPDDKRTATTGDDGVLLLQALRPEKYEVTIEARGHARASKEFELSGPDQEVAPTFSLAAGGVVRGIVQNASGKPLVGAHVIFWSTGVPYGYHGETSHTNEKGEYYDRYLPLNTSIGVQIELKDYLSTKKKEVTLTDRQRELSVDFTLEKRPPGGSIAGVVTDAKGRPVAGAAIGNYGNQSDDKRETKTDEQGRFVLHDLFARLPFGPEIFVQAHGFAPVQQKVDPGTADAPARISIELKTGHSARGRVESKAGKPLAGATVSVHAAQYSWHFSPYVLTDVQGRFEFDSLPEGSRFAVSAEGFSDLPESPLPLDEDEAVVVALEPAGALRGQVVDAESGRPITQFHVRAAINHGGTFGAHFEPRGQAIQAKDGKFLIKRLVNETEYTVLVEADGYLRTLEPNVLAGPADDAETVRIELTKRDASKLASLRGKVLDHAEKPVGGVQIRLIVSASAAGGAADNRYNWQLITLGQLEYKSYVDQFLSTVSDEQGDFQFKHLLPGKFLQLAYWGDKAPQGKLLDLLITEPGEDQSATINLPEPAVIRGSYIAAAFPDAGEILLNHEDQPFLTYRAKPAAGKTDFKFENLPPGRYSVAISSQPQRAKDNPQMYLTRYLARSVLVIESGETYVVEFAEDDRIE